MLRFKRLYCLLGGRMSRHRAPGISPCFFDFPFLASLPEIDGSFLNSVLFTLHKNSFVAVINPFSRCFGFSRLFHCRKVLCTRPVAFLGIKGPVSSTIISWRFAPNYQDSPVPLVVSPVPLECSRVPKYFVPVPCVEACFQACIAVRISAVLS